MGVANKRVRLFRNGGVANKKIGVVFFLPRSDFQGGYSMHVSPCLS